MRPPRPLPRRPERPGARSYPVPPPPIETAPARPAPAVRVPLGPVLLAAVVAAGAALRLSGLDATALTVREARQAFAAWAVAQGVRPPEWTADATSVLTSHLFRLGADGDAWPRLVSALAGALLVLAVYALARPGGNSVAFIASALVALSPTAVAGSRTASPGALGALVAALLAAAILWHWQRPRPLALWAAGLMAGLALGTDAAGMTGLLGCLLFLAMAVWSDDASWREAAASFRRWLWASALGLGVGILLSIVHWGDGAAGPLAAPRLWGELFALPGDAPALLPALALLLYDWPLALLGLAGAALVLRDALWSGGLRALPPWERMALCWLAPGLLVLLASTGWHEGALVVLAVPLSLLGTRAFAWAASLPGWRQPERWAPVTALVLGCVVASGIVWTLWARPFTEVSIAEVWGVWGAGMLALWGLWLGSRYLGAGAAVASGLAAVAALAVLFWPHTLWAVGFHAGSEPLLGPRFTSAMPVVERELAGLAGPDLPVTLSPRTAPVLGWRLRHLPLVVGDPPSESSVYVTEEGSPAPRGFAPLGPARAVAQNWRWRGIDGLGVWRWLLLREPYGPADTWEVQVMVRT